MFLHIQTLLKDVHKELSHVYLLGKLDRVCIFKKYLFMSDKGQNKLKLNSWVPWRKVENLLFCLSLKHGNVKQDFILNFLRPCLNVYLDFKYTLKNVYFHSCKDIFGSMNKLLCMNKTALISPNVKYSRHLYTNLVIRTFFFEIYSK